MKKVKTKGFRFVSGHVDDTCCVASLAMASGIRYYDVLQKLKNSGIYTDEEMAEKSYAMDDDQWLRAVDLFSIAEGTGYYRIRESEYHKKSLDPLWLSHLEKDFLITQLYADGRQHVMLWVYNDGDPYIRDCNSVRDGGIRRDFSRIQIIEAIAIKRRVSVKEREDKVA